MSIEESKKRTALVTGAARGIGLACATHFAKSGIQVAITDIDFETAAAETEILKSAGYDVVAIRMDVRSEEEVKNGMAECISVFGGLDILLSNAGIQIVHPFNEFPFAEWKDMMAVHADGAFLTSQAAYKHMMLNGGGQIIFMASLSSYEAPVLKVPYTFAKHGLVGLSKVLAKEGAEYNIHTYCVCPAFVRTALVENQIPEQALALGLTEEEVIRDVMLKSTVDGKFTSLEEVARIVKFAADDISGSHTGQSFIISHGWGMR